MPPALTKADLEAALATRFGSAFRPREKPAPQMIPTGVEEVDALAGGIPRGAITEIHGPASSGRTSLLHSILAQATARQEPCALVDVSDAFDPATAAAAGVKLNHLLWVRCAGKSKHALQALALVLQNGGFGLVALDLADIAPRDGRRIPLAAWFRFQRVLENRPTALILVGQEAYAKSCSALVLEMSGGRAAWSGAAGCSLLLDGLELGVARRKPVRREASVSGGVLTSGGVLRAQAEARPGPRPGGRARTHAGRASSAGLGSHTHQSEPVSPGSCSAAGSGDSAAARFKVHAPR
jgi:recombination protein RecA